MFGKLRKDAVDDLSDGFWCTTTEVKRTEDLLVGRVIFETPTRTSDVEEECAKGEILWSDNLTTLQIVEERATEFSLCRLLEHTENWLDKLLLLRLQVVEQVALDAWRKRKG